MDAWAKLLDESDLAAGDAWEHLQSTPEAQAPDPGVTVVPDAQFTMAFDMRRVNMTLRPALYMQVSRTRVSLQLTRPVFTMTLATHHFDMELCECN